MLCWLILAYPPLTQYYSFYRPSTIHSANRTPSESLQLSLPLLHTYVPLVYPRVHPRERHTHATTITATGPIWVYDTQVRPHTGWAEGSSCFDHTVGLAW
jgi:hypothetical protein